LLTEQHDFVVGYNSVCAIVRGERPFRLALRRRVTAVSAGELKSAS
jgi:hypothetical protein